MSSTEQLRQDHAVIEGVLRGVETLAARLEGGARVSHERIVAAIEFFGAFVDRCHHAKEEEALFPLLAEHGLPNDSGPLAVLRGEHEECRERLGVLACVFAANGEARKVVPLLRSYVAVLREHIAREEQVLFPYADRVLSAEDESRAQHLFAEIEAREVAPGGREALLELAGAFERACQASEERPVNGTAGIRVDRIMRRNVVAVRPDDSLARAAAIMGSLGTRELPVVDGRALVGILACHDLLPYQGHAEWTPVRTAMTPRPVTAAPEMPVREAARILLGNTFNCLPVLHDGTLVGMVGRSELLRVLAGEV